MAWDGYGEDIGRYALMVTSARPEETFVTLDDIKAHSRIDGADDDPLLQLMILAVQDWAEGVTGRALQPTSYQMMFDRFPQLDRPINFPRSPGISLDSISYIDYLTQQTLELTVSGSGSQVICNINGREPIRVTPTYLTYWPRTLPVIDAVTMCFTAGYPDDTDPVVSALKLIMCKQVSTWYEYRESIGSRLSVQEMPGLASFEALLAPYIIYGFGA